MDGTRPKLRSTCSTRRKLNGPQSWEAKADHNINQEVSTMKNKKV